MRGCDTYNYFLRVKTKINCCTLSYMNKIALFRQFEKISSKNHSVFDIIKSVSQTIQKVYNNEHDLNSFQDHTYKKMYREWGNLGVFNHHENGIDPLTYGMICYAIEKVDSGLRSGYSVQSSLVINPIEKFGSKYIRERFLPKLYDGQHIGCFGLTEPDAGSDPSSMKTRAVLDGSFYIVNGSKTWITNSPIADTFVIWCKNEQNKIIGLVSERKNGIETPMIKDKLTLQSSPTGMILMNNLKIPVENQLYVEGLQGAFHCLNKARYGISWGVIGATEDILDVCIKYCDERIQFQKKLTENQMVQRDLVHCITLYNDMLNRSVMSLECVQSFDDLKKNIALVSLLKRKNCSDALDVSRICRDLLGGNGVSTSYHIMRHLINLEAVNTYEGTRNIHDMIVGRSILNKNSF
jgi:glutaryl-CoA dehydrogenase